VKHSFYCTISKGKSKRFYTDESALAIMVFNSSSGRKKNKIFLDSLVVTGYSLRVTALSSEFYEICISAISL